MWLTKALLAWLQPWPSSLLRSDFVQGPVLASVSPSVKWKEGAKKPVTIMHWGVHDVLLGHGTGGGAYLCSRCLGP